ncbi:MAG: preprotein translocase subunit SecG [Clostridia bacterium]|nr:preprotein translocase subunit SecG [Clostridia bacterium]MDE6757798.1 preprotein translocase subunit SecG [Clostridia bacterium]MDE7078717.1 preprotein translocase subunit SecG [Clostridia bacterium]
MNLLFLLGDSLFPYQVYNWLRPLLMMLMLLSGIATIVIIMMQKPQNDNIGVIGGQESDSYSKKNKSRSKESILKKLTITGAVLMAFFAIFFFITFIQV